MIRLPVRIRSVLARRLVGFRTTLVATVMAIASGTLPAASAHPGLDMAPAVPHPLSISSPLVQRMLNVTSIGGVGSAGAEAMGSPANGTTEPAAEPDTGEAGLALQERFRLETPRWYGQFADFPSRGSEAFVRVHGWGAVYAMRNTKETLWSRPAMSFYEDWGLQPTPYAPIVILGNDPFDPLARDSENPFVVADVNGDSVEDVVVSHHLYLPAALAGNYITVLDGRTGETLWASDRLVGFVSHITATELAPSPGLEIVFAYEPGTGPSVVRAIDLVGSEDELLWTFDTKTTKGRFLHLDRISEHPPLIAASWSPGTGAAGPKGQLLALAADGTVAWSKDTTGYVATFRRDPLGSQIVVQEYLPPEVAGGDRYSYALRALRVTDGHQLVSDVVRTDALMTAFDVGDVDRDGQTEWVVSELELIPPTGRWTYTRVVALEQDGSARWTYQLQSDTEMEIPYMMTVEPGGEPRVVVAAVKTVRAPTVTGVPSTPVIDGALLDRDAFYAVRGDATGAVTPIWRHVDTGTFPYFLHRTTFDGKPALLIGTQGRGGGRVYDTVSGARLGTVEVLADPHVVKTLDLNADGIQDFLIGGGSEVLYALDGSALDPIEPGVLWTSEIGGTIHDLVFADLTGDGSPEAVVAAERRIVAVDLEDGRVMWIHHKPADRHRELYWTLGTGDLNRDGRDDLVVPGASLLALDGRNGQQLWDYKPTGGGGEPSYFSNVAMADANGDGTQDAAAEFTVDYPSNLAPRQVVGALMINGATGVPLWEKRIVQPDGASIEVNNQPELWNSVLAYPGATGPRVAFVYEVRSAPLAEFQTPRPRIDVFDARTGNLAWSTGRMQVLSGLHSNVLRSPNGGDELFTFNNEGFSRQAPGGLVETHSHSSLDAAFFRGPDGRQHLVWSKQLQGLSLFPPSVTWGPPSDDPKPESIWNVGYNPNSAIEVTDLDGDGVDEILSVPWDCDAWAQIHNLVLFASCGEVYTAEGFSILEPIEAS